VPGDESLHEVGQQHFLIHHGRAHVHVENGRPRLDLFVGEAQRQREVARLQFGYELLLACGVDAFTDDAHRGVTTHPHEVRPRGEDNAHATVHRKRGGNIGHCLPQGCDMVGCRATAAAKHTRPHGGEGSRLLGERGGGQPEHSLAVDEFGQSGIGLDEHRHGSGRQQRGHHIMHLVGPCTAIGAQQVHPEVEHGGDEHLGCAAREADTILERHGDGDGKRTLRTGCDDSGTRLGKVELCLDHQEIGTTCDKPAHLLPKGGD